MITLFLTFIALLLMGAVMSLIILLKMIFVIFYEEIIEPIKDKIEDC